MTFTKGSKRKAGALGTTSRKTKIVTSLNDLPWKTVSRPRDTVEDGDDGILELEEVDGVEIVYENTESGRVATFKTSVEALQSGESPTQKIEAEQAEIPNTPNVVVFDTQKLLPAWASYDLHPLLMHSLFTRDFLTPTPIQERALPIAQSGRDVIAVAETGSGKTLAYGLPLLNHLMNQRLQTLPRGKRVLSALILAPTRELALQVSTHLNACVAVSDIAGGSPAKTEKPGEGSNSAQKQPPLVSVATIVGGMSAQKQRRILDRGVDVLVATPGRLWDLLEQDDDLAEQVRNLRFLVLDEADRMIETGHFEELDRILRLTLRNKETNDADIPAAPGVEQTITPTSGLNQSLQTLVFSATMSKDLQMNLKKRKFKSRAPTNKTASTLDDLLLRLDFRDAEPQIIDLSPDRGVVATLRESRVECLSADKDVYLYYFLLRYPGKSLVFLSAIDGIRRLMPLMDLLGLKAYPLHSQLEQRQRLRNLDRFKSTPNAILLATDIAARGLDIPAVDHVVHYQLPRATDIYVHRNGRTARASRDGFSLLMCAPDERRVLRGLLSSLKRDESEIHEIAVELYMLDRLKERVQLARKIETAQHKVQKENHERKWLREAAKAMEVELDSDLDSDREQGPSKHERKKNNVKAAKMKAELKDLLAQPLIARGISTRYITSGSTAVVDDIINDAHHSVMLGASKSRAGTELLAARRPNRKPQPVFEEWTGIGNDI